MGTLWCYSIWIMGAFVFWAWYGENGRRHGVKVHWTTPLCPYQVGRWGQLHPASWVEHAFQFGTFGQHAVFFLQSAKFTPPPDQRLSTQLSLRKRGFIIRLALARRTPLFFKRKGIKFISPHSLLLWRRLSIHRLVCNSKLVQQKPMMRMKLLMLKTRGEKYLRSANTFVPCHLYALKKYTK